MKSKKETRLDAVIGHDTIRLLWTWNPSHTFVYVIHIPSPSRCEWPRIRVRVVDCQAPHPVASSCTLTES